MRATRLISGFPESQMQMRCVEEMELRHFVYRTGHLVSHYGSRSALRYNDFFVSVEFVSFYYPYSK